MSPFKDFNDLVEPLVLPIGGKNYTIPPVGAKDARVFDQALNSDAKGADIPTDAEFFRIFLGAAHDEMIQDNVPGAAVTRAAYTALADYQRGRAVAEIFWATGAEPGRVKSWLEENVTSGETVDATTDPEAAP